jgi:hypothetical protein
MRGSNEAARVHRTEHRGPRRGVCLADEVIDRGCGVECEFGAFETCRQKIDAALGDRMR